MPSPRTFLVLGRVSNLPTVWSNCLAGWWLGGATNLQSLPFLIAGVSFLYVGGMYLNDAFDVEFDRQHRRERPIPSGKISPRAVWQIGLLCLVLGEISLLGIGLFSAALGLVLASCIVLYDAVHKLIKFSPIVMAACRFLVYVVAGSATGNPVTGWTIWAGLALAFYVVGLSYLARTESTSSPIRYWPLFLLTVPLILALVMNANVYCQSALLLAAILGLWTIRCLRTVFQRSERNIGRAVAGLLAGIVFVDWLAIADAPMELGLVLVLLFGLALLFQRFIPAT
jgi:4-hydroxybenzoate polyprenyltransferase